MSLKVSENKFLRISDIILCSLLSVILLCFVFLHIKNITKLKSVIQKSSSDFLIEDSLIYAVIATESNFNANAVSEKGAYGLMQITVTTFSYVCEIFGFDYTIGQITDPGVNVTVGSAYLRYLFDRFLYVREVLAAYNAGEGNVRSWLSQSEYSADGKTLSVIPFSETDEYVGKVLSVKKFFEGI